MKYPLTPETKLFAKQLAGAWSNNQLDQTFYVFDTTAGSANTVTLMFGLGRLDEALDLELRLGHLRELDVYGLIDIKLIRDDRGKRTEITLLQELRNAVENDFAVSEYFLTMNAVGTIVQGNLTMQPGSVLQSAASNTGNITQNLEQIADSLQTILGDDFLKAQTELSDAIHALREAADADKQPKLGKVISELGRCLQHGANTATVTIALGMLTPILQGIV